MTFTKSINSFPLLSLALLGAILLSQGLVEARGTVGVNPFCHKAKFFQLCNTMVGPAANPKDAALASLKATRVLAAQIPELTTAVTNIINTGVTTPNPNAKAAVIKQCTDVFQNAVEDIDLSITAVEGDDNFTAAVKLSAINFSECSAAMEEYGVTMPMEKVVTQFERHVSNCLAVVQGLAV